MGDNGSVVASNGNDHALAPTRSIVMRNIIFFIVFAFEFYVIRFLLFLLSSAAPLMLQGEADECGAVSVSVFSQHDVDHLVEVVNVDRVARKSHRTVAAQVIG